jgi:hypothetical protein
MKHFLQQVQGGPFRRPIQRVAQKFEGFVEIGLLAKRLELSSQSDTVISRVHRPSITDRDGGAGVMTQLS